MSKFATKKVMVGDVRRAYGRDYVVVSLERGRPGESRTMVVVALHRQPGVLCPAEARDLGTVAEWPKMGRMRVSLRDQYSYHAATWKGEPARLGADA